MLSVAIPSQQYMRKLNTTYKNTGSSLNSSKCGHPRSICNEENLQTLAQAFVASPGELTRKASAELGISRRSVQRMLERLKFKPFRPSLLQMHHEDDSDRRLEFRETIIIRSEAFCD
ncbi:hypothetical protein J6590_007853 [Homalodisca vitripennis]|nr:hypothetical protein J6590_007853 [Homalodisca vitripennis]